jgi:polar amino acid transport system ATP-binding protein
MNRIRTYYGMVFQNFNLFPHYSVMKNITDAPIHVQKRQKDEVYEEARALLKRMGLDDKENAYPCQLSGGQCQRVAIARAICTQPKLLLADEPTGALDSRSGQQIMDIFDSLHERGMSIIMITHELAVAKRASEMMHIYDGVLSKEGVR